MPRQNAECAYCGQVGPTSDDHVPPKSFFEGLAKEQLRTVKACDECNAGASQDDEYFRDTVVKYYRIADQEKAKPIVEKMIRAAALPAKRSYAESHLRSLTGVFGVSPTAPALGPVLAARIDVARMERAARRYVRGLHRHDFGTRVSAAEVPLVVTDPEAVFEKQATLVELFRGGTRHVVQEGVFEYLWTEDTRGMKACLLVFFREYAVFACVGRPTESPKT